MKLQLDKKNLACMVLTPSEAVTATDAHVLRVGFRKLLGTARTTFIIDITRAVVDADAEHLVLETQIDALANKIRLVIVGTNPRVCQAMSMKGAQAIMSSVIQLDRVLVPQLQSLYKRLAIRRKAAIARLESPDPADQPGFVMAENSRLLAEVDNLEEEVEALLKVHVVPEPLPAQKAEMAELEKRLGASLIARKINLQESEPFIPTGSLEASAVPTPVTSFSWIEGKNDVKELAQGELKVELQAIETEVVELEKKVRRLVILKAENEECKQRLAKLRRVLYALLHYAMHSSEPLTVEKKLRILSTDLEDLASMVPGTSGLKPASE